MERNKEDDIIVFEDDDDDDYGFMESFKVADRALALIGLRIFYDETPGFSNILKNRLFFIITVIELSFTIVGEVTNFLGAKDEEFLTRADLFACIAFSTVGFSKMLVLFFKRNVLQHQFEEIHKLWPKGKDLPPAVLKIKNKSLKRLKFTTTTFFWLYLIVITLYNSDPLVIMVIDLLMGKTCYNALPYAVWLPFDPMAPIVFQLTFLYLTWSGYIASVSIVAQDCMFQVSCSHLCMLIEILSHDLLNCIPEDNSYSIDNRDETQMIKKLNSIIKKHQKIIRLSEILEETYNWVIMVNIIAASFIICIVGFQLTLAGTEQLSKFSVATIGTVMQAYILCWYGNMLMEKSTGFADAAYNSLWYNAGPRFKSTILILMMRSQKPIFVTAFKFSKISLNTFTSIVGKSWSYFTLLKTVYEP